MLHTSIFDRPKIVQPKPSESQQQRLKIVFEADESNTELVTNPHAMWKLMRADLFLSLPEDDQSSLLDILTKTLQKQASNCHILSDMSTAAQQSLMQNQMAIKTLQQGKLLSMTEQQGYSHDLLFQLLLIGLNSTHDVVDAIKLLRQGNPQLERCHVELLYQYARLGANTSKVLQLLSALIQQESPTQSYFYFNGFLSGILLHQKNKQVQLWPFTKGFAACMWFNIASVSEGKNQDQMNLPVLFNCFSQGYGGFECYFNQNKLFYRILPPNAYQPPTIDSNGFLISEFTPGKWNYLAIEHDKPFLARAQLVAVVNDKQVVSFGMDYPKFDKASKLNQVCMCNNFVGLMSNFLLFKDQVNNPQKFVQIYKQHTPDFKDFDLHVFEQRLQEKLFLIYSPTRANSKTVYDLIDMNDGELLVNCGVWGQPRTSPILQEQGGLQGLLPLLDKCTTVDQVNSFLRVVLQVLPSHQDKLGNFFQLLFCILSRLDPKIVNCQTVQILTELRVIVQSPEQNDALFLNLLRSADFWINTENFDVMSEYWSFVKAIYSQNPVRHNTIFPIHNLISLMVKLSDTSACCNYHIKTNELFYGQAENQSDKQIDKYLEPIAGVLECVLTQGGSEILAQIDYITRSLTMKTSACFQVQILSLLKVLLLDSKSHSECASPLEFAQRLLQSHGLQILLHLCSNNAALDVKALCIKLIDVLSSHSNLVQMRIDTDLITYLSHVLLPANLRHKPMSLALQQQVGSQHSDNVSPENNTFKFFSYQEAAAEDEKEVESSHEQSESKEDIQSVQESDHSQEYIPPPPPKTSKHANQGFKFGSLALDSDEDEDVVPKMVLNKKGPPKGLVNLQIQDSDEDAPPSRANFQKKFGDKILGDYDSDNETAKNDAEPPKPTVDVLMSRNLKSGANKGFNFAESSDGSQNSEETKEVFISKPPPKKFGGFAKNLQLEIQEDAPQTAEEPQHRGGTTGATNDNDFEEIPKPAKKTFKKPQFGLQLDTDKINELFTFGGEHGEMKDEQANEKLEDDIKELALICVTAMRQVSKVGFKRNTDLNKNQQVKGIKQIDLTEIPDAEAESYKSNSSSIQQLEETQKSQSDDQTRELENLYTSCLEWILNRAPSSLFKTMTVDDYDKITFLPAMQVLMILVSHSNNLVRQRALQDMFMLAQWDAQNGQLLLQHKSFHCWLLELLTPYLQESHSESSKAVFDMGCKLHSLLLKNSCVSPDEDGGFKKLNLLARWPSVLKVRGFETKAAHELTRSLIIQLCSILAAISQAQKNLIHLTLLVHELILSSTETQNKPKQGHNESLFNWVLRSHLRYLENDGETKDWSDWSIALAATSCWDIFFVGAKSVTFETEHLDKLIRTHLYPKSQDELHSIVEVLMQDDLQPESSKQSYQSKLFSGFRKSDGKSNQAKESVFMLQAVINITCLALTQATADGNITQIRQWLSRLELYFKFTLTVSELWRGKQEDQQYNRIQKRMAETCSFMLAYLFREIHNTQTPKNTSPQKDHLQTKKAYQSCLKQCLIMMISLAGMQQDQPGTRCIQVILQQILVKQYSNSSKPLISSQDISRLIESNFDEFPECFQQNDWKIAFFHNSLINAAIESQLNLEMVENLKLKSNQFAQRLQEAEASTTQANDEIFKKIQADTLQAISEVTHSAHDSQNESLLLLDFEQRNVNSELNQWVKDVTSSRATWHCQSRTFLKLKNQMLSEGQRCLFKDCSSNTFTLHQDHSLEPTIFKEVVPQSQFLTQAHPYYFSCFSAKLTKSQLSQLKFANKQLLLEQAVQSLKPVRKVILECNGVAILRALEKRQGSLVLTNYEIIFVYDVSADESNSTIFFFQWKPNKKLTKQVCLSDVKEIQKRRFLGQNKSLELFLMDNKTLLIDFMDVEQRDQFAKKLLRQRQIKCKNLSYFSSLDPKHILAKSKLTEDWVNCKISNFKYLASLNQLANRSYHDLSQYPVFPWVLSFQKSSQAPDLTAINMRGGAPPSHFRDLNKNMQLLGSAERQAEFKRKFEDLEGFAGIDDRFHCGSHYSNPGIVLHYLVRLQPMLEANVVLQGGTMDHPDRIFQSVTHSYQHSLHDFSDVRELIPEFYCMPELFSNHNLIKFGTKEDGSSVDNVILPEWASQSGIKFVQQMREAFESPYVSQNLNSWIDYIFGYKQRDQDAINCLNTFSKITYQIDQPGDFDILTLQDQSMRAALENQGYNFGQTPLQLFKEKHPCKLTPIQALKTNLVVDDLSKLKIFKPVPVIQPNKLETSSMILGEAIMFAKFIDNQKIIGAKKEGFAQNFVWLPRAHDQNPSISFSLGSDRKQKFCDHEFINGIHQVDRSLKKFDYPMTISNDGNYIVKGGFWDGKVIFCPVEGSPVAKFELNDHKQTVCVIQTDSMEKTMITGTKTGEVILWRNANFDCQLDAVSDSNPWVNIKTIHDHDRQITSIFINEEMCLFLTASTDSFVNMYNLWTGKLVRTFNHSLPVYQAVLVERPIPMVAYFSRDDHMWYSQTLNGQQFPDTDKKVKYEEASHIVSPLVIKSSNYSDKLVYGTERGYICLRHMPTLERYRKLQVSKDYPVLTLIVSPDRRFLLTGCGDGGLIVITERVEATAATPVQKAQSATILSSISQLVGRSPAQNAKP